MVKFHRGPTCQGLLGLVSLGNESLLYEMSQSDDLSTRTTNLSGLKTVFISNFFQIWPRNKLSNFLAGPDCSYLPAPNMYWQVQENQYPIVNPIQSSFYRKEHSQSVSVGVSPNKGRTPSVFKINVSEPFR